MPGHEVVGIEIVPRCHALQLSDESLAPAPDCLTGDSRATEMSLQNLLIMSLTGAPSLMCLISSPVLQGERYIFKICRYLSHTGGLSPSLLMCRQEPPLINLFQPHPHLTERACRKKITNLRDIRLVWGAV